MAALLIEPQLKLVKVISLLRVIWKQKFLTLKYLLDRRWWL